MIWESGHGGYDRVSPMEQEPLPAKCPNCGDGRVARIAYGEPAPSEELTRAIEAGEIVLGGCCVFQGSPKWQCLTCNQSWGVIDWEKD